MPSPAWSRRGSTARGQTERDAPADLPAVGITMFGVTTPAVQKIAADLRDDFECLVFHATGVGGRSMEKLVDSGMLAGVIDLTTTEVCDLLMGGVFPATEDRFGAIIRTRLPYIGSVGALDMVNFGAPDTIPERYRQPQIPRSQSAGDADAHHAGGERAHRALDRRAAQPDGRAGALLPAGRRRLRARCAGPAVLGSRGRRGAVHARWSAPCARPATASSSASSSHINDPEFASAIVSAFRPLVGRPGTRRRVAR